MRPLARAGDVPTSFQSSQPWESRLGPCARGCAVPCGTTPRTAALCHSALCCAMPCRTVPCRAAPCHAVPCGATQRRAMLCHVVPCRAVPCRGAGCSPLTAPPARAQAAGSVCWRLCTFQFLGHSPSKPLRGRRQLGAVTNNRRAPMTPAPSTECQHRGDPGGGQPPFSSHPTEWTGEVLPQSCGAGARGQGRGSSLQDAVTPRGAAPCSAAPSQFPARGAPEPGLRLCREG